MKAIDVAMTNAAKRGELDLLLFLLLLVGLILLT